MPKFYSELQEAALENKASDPTAGVAGRIIHNTTEARIKTDDGSNFRALLRNDLKCVIGNHATAANNIRFHRGASAVLQMVLGNDATAEGSLSTALAQLSVKHETYTDAGKPAAGQAGRIIWVSDLLTFLGDNGTSWIQLGSAGGGAPILWYEDENAPALSTINRSQVYSFGSGLSQALWSELKIPSSYSSGRPVTLKINHYSADTSGTFLLQSVSTLLRNNNDVVSSTTNQRTSTNSAITASGSNQNKIQTASLDLTSSTGQINGVSVAAGDTILIQLTRGSDSAAGNIGFLPKQSEVLFS